MRQTSGKTNTHVACVLPVKISVPFGDVQPTLSNARISFGLPLVSKVSKVIPVIGFAVWMIFWSCWFRMKTQTDATHECVNQRIKGKRYSKPIHKLKCFNDNKSPVKTGVQFHRAVTFGWQQTAHFGMAHFTFHEVPRI